MLKHCFTSILSSTIEWYFISDVEAEAVGSGVFQMKRKGSFQIFASLPEVEAVLGQKDIEMQITDIQNVVKYPPICSSLMGPCARKILF